MAGIWDLIIEAPAETHDGSVQMIGTSIVRVHLYRARNLLERFCNRIKQCRRAATRYDKLAANDFAITKLAAIRIWLRAYESTP
jgi:transposase